MKRLILSAMFLLLLATSTQAIVLSAGGGGSNPQEEFIFLQEDELPRGLLFPGEWVIHQKMFLDSLNQNTSRYRKQSFGLLAQDIITGVEILEQGMVKCFEKFNAQPYVVLSISTKRGDVILARIAIDPREDDQRTISDNIYVVISIILLSLILAWIFFFKSNSPVLAAICMIVAVVVGLFLIAKGGYSKFDPSEYQFEKIDKIQGPSNSLEI